MLDPGHVEGQQGPSYQEQILWCRRQCFQEVPQSNENHDGMYVDLQVLFYVYLHVVEYIDYFKNKVM